MATRKRKAKKKSYPRKRHVLVTLLNVIAHPHDEGADTYEKLWRAAVDSKTTVRFHGDKIARIGDVTKREDGFLVGEIWICTKVDISKGVIDTDSGKDVDDEEVKRIRVNWNSRGFNPKKFTYAFSPADHQLGFDRQRVSPVYLQKILQFILRGTAVRAAAKVEDVTVEIVQERQQLDRILALKLDRLTIRVTKPNPTDLAGMSERLRAEMDGQGAGAETTMLEAGKGQALKPNATTTMKAELALSNGEVTGKGRNEDGRSQTLTTADAPMQEGATWHPKHTQESLPDVVVRVTRDLAKRARAQLDKIVDPDNLPPSIADDVEDDFDDTNDDTPDEQ